VNKNQRRSNTVVHIFFKLYKDNDLAVSVWYFLTSIMLTALFTVHSITLLHLMPAASATNFLIFIYVPGIVTILWYTWLLSSNKQLIS